MKEKEGTVKDHDNNGKMVCNEERKKNGEKEVKELIEEEEKQEKELEELKARLKEAEAKRDEYFNMLQRVAAEFDNYKKRTQKEKETFSKEITCEIVAAFIPVLDNLERALDAAGQESDAKSIREGIELVYNQFIEILKNLGVEPIKSIGEKFDPVFHDAVMHVEDEAYGENVVVEELRKGYMVEDRVIRHSMVKVAN